jgi:hypothetical protein
MALALNVFKTVTAEITTTPTVIYTAPIIGYTGIVLMAQVTNVTATTTAVTVSYDNGATLTELLKNFDVPGNDAVAVLTGKLVIPTGKSFSVSAAANSRLKITMSILETANE